MRKLLYGLLLGLFVINATAAVYKTYYGPTVAQDNLYQIAYQIRPQSSVTVQQVMVAVVQANPTAFNQNNINGLKSGYKLSIPSLAAIQQISPEHAYKIVTQQNIAWNTKSAATKQLAVATNHKSRDKSHAVTRDDPNTPETVVAGNNHYKNTSESKSRIIAAKKTAMAVPSMTLKQDPPNVSAVVMDKLAPFMQTTTKLQQQTNTQIAYLQQQTKLLQAKINQLSHDLRKMTDSFTQLSNKAKNTKNSSQALWSNLQFYGPGLVLSVLLLLLLVYLLLRTFSAKSNIQLANQNPETPLEANRSEEYDFMNSTESIPSKLDLGRAYLDMGDYASATHVLQEVVDKGTEQQQKEATELLAKTTVTV